MSCKDKDVEKDVADDEVMCHCSGTRRGNIRQLSEQGMDIDAISRWTGALSGCGGCEWDIADFLKDCRKLGGAGGVKD